MFCCPFCTVCYANACTDMNAKLGGERVSSIWSAITTWCCMCCVIAQDAEALDLATGAHTDLCGVKPGVAGLAGGFQPIPLAGGPLATAAPSGPVGTLGTGTSFL